MNYIGSKQRLSEFILSTMRTVVGTFQGKHFAEPFAGTGIIARQLKNHCSKLLVNDIEPYSYVLLKNYIGNTQFLSRATSLIDALQNLPEKEGFIYQNYCLGSQSGRQYFSDANGKKIDAIRQKIQDWQSEQYIQTPEYYFLLASLLESADKVANTASVYGAFLKKLKTSAQKGLVLAPASFEASQSQCEVYQMDANVLIQKIQGDILYLDPPYNARQYGANYHLLNTIAHYEPFEPQGKTGLPSYQRSAYCQKNKVKQVFEQLIAQAQFPYIFLSYNNEGLMSVQEVRSILSKYGKYEVFTKKYQRFKADKSENRQHKANSTLEYLHVLHKA